jgi:hypothetical protein
LTNTVLSAGTRFLHENEDLTGLINTLSTSKRLNPEQTAYRLPVALFLAGSADEAVEALDARLGQIAGRMDPAGTRYVTFAARLRDRIGRAKGVLPGA